MGDRTNFIQTFHDSTDMVVCFTGQQLEEETGARAPFVSVDNKTIPPRYVRHWVDELKRFAKN